jgi:hypothetical protein
VGAVRVLAREFDRDPALPPVRQGSLASGNFPDATTLKLDFGITYDGARAYAVRQRPDAPKITAGFIAMASFQPARRACPLPEDGSCSPLLAPLIKEAEMLDRVSYNRNNIIVWFATLRLPQNDAVQPYGYGLLIAENESSSDERAIARPQRYDPDLRLVPCVVSMGLEGVSLRRPRQTG